MLPPPARRFGGALCVVAASLPLLLWFDAAGAGAATGRNQAGASRANEILREARREMGMTDTLEADVDGQIGADHFTGTLMLKRPNLARLQIHGSEGLGDFQAASDGQSFFVYFPDDNHYTRVAVRPDGANIDAFIVDQVKQFFNPQNIGGGSTDAPPRYVGARRFEGIDGDVLMAGPESKPAFYFVSHGDHLVRRVAPIAGMSSHPPPWALALCLTREWCR